MAQNTPGNSQSTSVAQEGKVLAKAIQGSNAPSSNDVYCAGFVSHEPVKADVHVVGGPGSPEEAHFSQPQVIYLDGSGMKEGDVFSILRPLQDPNKFEAFPRQRAMLSKLGQPYAEIGRTRVRVLHGNIAVSDVQLSCSEILPGDMAVPFVEKAIPKFRNANFDRFAPPNGKTTGRIVTAKEFDTYLGYGGIAYLNVGSNDEIKVGDYLRTFRSPHQVLEDPAESLSYEANVRDDTRKGSYNFNLKNRAKDLPRRSLGEMMVIGVTPTTATAFVTLALEDIHVGDSVELEEERPESAPAATTAEVSGNPNPANPASPASETAPSEQAGAAQPPVIYCSANPATVRVGESANISCNASSPMNRPVTIKFESIAGQITPRFNHATLDTTGVPPGPIAIQATASDDAGLSASATTIVNVEAAPQVPSANQAAELEFKLNSSYVNNEAKAVLDDVALRLQHEPTTTALLVGSTAPNENAQMGLERAVNAGKYLTKSKGIDATRIQTKAAPQQGGNKVEVWVIPAGAPAPQ